MKITDPPAHAGTMDGGSLARAVLRELRPRQWTKNALVFAGLVFSHRLGDLDALLTSVGAFLVFCVVSSAAYVINDIGDLERDRLHPLKRTRPIARGVIPVPAAVALVALLMGLAVPAAFLLSWRFATVALVYFGIVLCYSFYLKHIVLVDVFAISAGFVLRAVAGTVVLGVVLSPWLLVCTILASLFIALAKRRHELVLLTDGAGGHRPILEQYTRQFLDQAISIVTSATVIAYSLYTFSAESLPEDNSMMLTIPIVLFALLRYLILIYVHNEGGSPETLLLRDRPLLLSILAWGAAVVLVLYAPWRAV